MGVNLTLHGDSPVQFRIREANLKSALEALKVMQQGKLQYSHWYASCGSCADLNSALRCFRWEGSYVQGDLVMVRPTSDYDHKYGDDDVVFSTLAPFVEEGSYIELIADDDEELVWRWVFDGHRVLEAAGVATWTFPNPEPLELGHG